MPCHKGDLLRKTIRLCCFHAIWCSALPQSRDSQQDPHEYVSKAVHRQLAIIVTQGIVDLEVEVLSQLQNIIFGCKGPGKQNMLPIWICLWLLMLMYRRTIELFSVKKRVGNTGPSLAKFMFDLLVSTYSGLFRTSSPMSLNWLKQEVFDMFGQDYRITHTMGTLKREFHYICQLPPFLAEVDSLTVIQTTASSAAFNVPMMPCSALSF